MKRKARGKEKLGERGKKGRGELAVTNSVGPMDTILFHPHITPWQYQEAHYADEEIEAWWH